MAATQPVAAVTGATSGIGRAIAVALAQEGAIVAIAGRNADEGQRTLELIEQAGASGHFTAVDARDHNAVESWIGDTHARYGRLDWLVNNAGMNGRSARLEECEVDEFEAVVATNLLSPFYSIRTAIPLMRAAGGGSIVNVGSTASLQGYGMLSAYTSSKHGLLGLTKSVALENADIPIRCNCICPGPVDTPLMRGIEQLIDPENPAAAHDMFAGTTALKRYGRPEEIAELVLFLLSDRSSYITGTSISVDGGVMTGV
jgi:NAD(P)-dependent dehydrogenase (short-subunit alcohol dehydrogenase family)